MPIRSAAVGTTIGPERADVTVRMAQAYAAGIGDRNPRYLDDAAPEGIVAPPSFCVSLEWPLLLAIVGSDTLGASLAERLRGVHAGQDSTFVRPICPGDVLATAAVLVEVRATRAGALAIVRLDTRLERDGAPVVTSHCASLYRGVGVDGPDVRIDQAPAFPQHPPAAPAETETIFVSREAAHVYTECARIWNPIHTERRVALEAGLPDVVLHGTATWALAARAIVDRFADGDPRRLRRLKGQFRALVIPGSTLTFEARRCGRSIEFAVLNDARELAIADGRALVDEAR